MSMVVALVLCLQAQEETLEAKRDKKLAEAWLKKADWITDYEKALKASAESGKPVFAYFSRSYAP
jgi:hypothetical protein